MSGKLVKVKEKTNEYSFYPDVVQLVRIPAPHLWDCDNCYFRGDRESCERIKLKCRKRGKLHIFVTLEQKEGIDEQDEWNAEYVERMEERRKRPKEDYRMEAKRTWCGGIYYPHLLD
jgi:hypothetical protein